MWLYFLLAVIAVLLILLHHYIPRKRVFWTFFAVLLLTGGASWYLYPRQEPPPPLTQAERDELAAQQEIFAAWYRDYQKQVDQLDNNWQRYHHILENFKEDNISIQTAYVRLTQLEKDSGELRERIARHTPPRELSDANYDLVTGITVKTNAYAEAQYRTIALSKAAADPANIRSDDREEQSRMLQSRMNRGSPTGRVRSSEVSALRAKGTLAAEEETEQP